MVCSFPLARAAEVFGQRASLAGVKPKEFAMVYCISYDLKRPGQSYPKLYEAIKGLGDWWHYLDSTWLVDAGLTASQIFERLKPHVDANDRILIAAVQADYSGWLEEEAWQWIRTHRLAA